jgi:carbon-monoxide dehydrogenase large subunit
MAGQAYAVFVRSRTARRHQGHRYSAAKGMPGVLAIYTGADLSAYGTMKCAVPFKNRDGSR